MCNIIIFFVVVVFCCFVAGFIFCGRLVGLFGVVGVVVLKFKFVRIIFCWIIGFCIVCGKLIVIGIVDI